MIDFYTVTALAIPEGKVSTITRKSDGAVLWKAGALPSLYQEVEWVQAAANVEAYIDLGFAFDTKAKIEMSQWMFNEGYASTYPFGATENSGKLRCCLSSPYGNQLGAYLYGSDGTTYIAVTMGNSGDEYSLVYGENEYILKLEKGCLQIENITVGGIATTPLQAEYMMTNHLYLFAQNYNGSPRFGGVRQIGYFRYYDKTGTLICDLVPCYRKSDGEIGMYDIVRKTFFANAGTGSFTKGADV